MNKKVIVLAAATLALLAGCDDSPYPDEEQAYVDEQAGQATRAQMAEDEKDQQAALKELQSKDPSVKDVYYSVGPNGEKQMHVVREEANGQNSDSMWPLVGGAAMGALGGYALAKMMNSNSGGYQNYQQNNRALSTQQYDEEERRKRRNTSSAGYTAAMMNNNRAAVRSAPNYQSNMKSKVSQWRSAPSSAPATVRAATTSRASAVMSGGGARASSHSSGG